MSSGDVTHTERNIAIAAVVAIAIGGAWLGVTLLHAFHNAVSPHPGARVRLVDHHCSTAKNGSVLVFAQLANNGRTGKVQASGYALLYGGRLVNAQGWQDERSIAAGSSEFFSGQVPVAAGNQVIGCGVLLGDGAPKGVSYLPPAG